MAKLILHMLSPLKHMSPFDVNMALDAGYDSVTPYINVGLEEMKPLVQDAMFSRSPRDAVRTAMFIGGKDAILALDMIDKAREDLTQALRDLGLCRSGRFLHHRRGDGRLRRKGPEGKEETQRSLAPRSSSMAQPESSDSPRR